MKKDIVRHGSLFSGIGGFDLAAQWMGWKNVFHCEISPFCRQVLKYYFPEEVSYEDIRKTDFSQYKGEVNVLTGGFPCQPYSIAGKRLGKNDERHLWPAMYKAIQQIRPQWVVGGNVRGIINWNEGLVFDEVQTKLEIQGYEVIPFLLPAAGISAPHKRERVWFIACLEPEVITDTTLSRSQKTTKQQAKLVGQNRRLDSNVTYTNSGKRSKGWQYAKRPETTMVHTGTCNACSGWKDWKDFPLESPLCTGNDGFPAIMDTITFSKWRTESLKAAGNAIVPQIAYRIFRVIQLFINQDKKIKK